MMSRVEKREEEREEGRKRGRKGGRKGGVEKEGGRKKGSNGEIGNFKELYKRVRINLGKKKGLTVESSSLSVVLSTPIPFSDDEPRNLWSLDDSIGSTCGT